MKGSYKDGKLDGPYTEWDQHGNITKQTTYKNGRDGSWIEYYKNGKKKNKVGRKDGKRNGPWVSWYQNGKKLSEGMYRNGKQEGVWTWWDEHGTITDKIT